MLDLDHKLGLGFSKELLVSANKDHERGVVLAEELVDPNQLEQHFVFNQYIVHYVT